MPTFPALNGQVKIPFRWYPNEALTSWNSTPCKGQFQENPFTLLSLMEALPPFQFWTAPTSATITSWTINEKNGGSIQADITADAALVVHQPFDGIDYWIYQGTDLSTPLPSVSPDNALYSLITFSDGSYQISELFRPTCQESSSGSGSFFWNFSTDGLVGWSTGSSSNDADSVYSGGSGAPPGTPADGTVTINLVDNKVYTFSGGSWNAGSTPSNGDYRLVASTGTWYCYNCSFPLPDGWEVMADPPFGISSNGACRSGPNPDGLGLFLNDVDFGPDPITFIIRILAGGHGNLHVQVGTEYLGTITTTGEHSFTISPGTTGPIELTTAGGWDGCIVSIRFGGRALDCNMLLEWTNCGNIGGIYYEGGFTNKLLLARDVEIIRPTATITTENTENGRKDQFQDQFRKEVEWKLPVGMVPWYLADALTELAAHDTIRLTQKLGLGTDELKRVRVVQSWPESDDDCLTRVDIFFQVDDETVASRCCDTFDPPCDPEIDPGEITGMTCFELDCDAGYVFTADIPSGYYGELLVSTDSGSTYSTTDLDLSSLAWASNTIPVEPINGLYAIRVYFADCEVGLTADFDLECCVLIGVFEQQPCVGDDSEIQITMGANMDECFDLSAVTYSQDGGDPVSVDPLEVGVPLTVGPFNASGGTTIVFTFPDIYGRASCLRTHSVTMSC